MIKRIHWDVVLLIIKTVMENPKILRTPLAQRCNRNYSQLEKYLSIMELLGLLVLEERNYKIYIKITQHGNDVYDKTKDVQ
jgi:predicted transcriptional regulator